MTDYQLDTTPVATGSQGAVYFGIQQATGRQVAVKVSSGGQGADRALTQEAKLLRQLQQAGVQGVMEVIDTIEVQGRPAMVMKRYPMTLASWLADTIRSPGSATLENVLSTMASIATTLDAVHRQPIPGGTLVHRDIKPENIFLDANRTPFVGDFGGAMAIEGLQAVELALFGTPMWAPLDQILPGKTIPDQTWDTYALCVMLYAAITGARPAYQANPQHLLTPAGRSLWDAAKRAIETGGDQQRAAQREFVRLRRGTVAGDLVDLTGHAALMPADRSVLETGIHRLCELAGVRHESEQLLTRGLWALLVRGLSPVSHPSPPNRFREAGELATLITDLKRVVMTKTTPPPSPSLEQLLHGEAKRPTLSLSPLQEHAPPASTLTTESTLASFLPPLLGVFTLAAISGAVWFAQDELRMLWDDLQPLPATVMVPETTLTLNDSEILVRSFSLDTTEVTVAHWNRCVAEHACPEVWQRRTDTHPVAGLGLKDAQQLCAFRGGRLPTEAEWHAAWGSPEWLQSPTCDHAQASGCGDNLRPVGEKRIGRTDVGAVDMAGNVAEWVAEGILMGGTVQSSLSNIGINGRKTHEGRHPFGGVRCAYDR